MFQKILTLVLVIFVIGSPSAWAMQEIMVTIKDHKFSPNVVEVPAGEKVKLVIMNEDPTPEEFESHELKREKIIQGNGKGVILIGPLEVGEYPFFGEFNEATAQGKVVVK